jgi:uncharacterized metal-binding protein YceD (DUF177 family)
MLKFKLHEIPYGNSSEVLTLKNTILEEFTIEGLNSAIVELSFNKSSNLIQVDAEIWAELSRVCDRSLEPFEAKVETKHRIIFKTELENDVDEQQLSMRLLDINSNQIDLTGIIRDSLFLAVPIRSLHPKFLDEDGEIPDFGTQQFGPSNTELNNDDLVDVRWAKLKQLKDHSDS